ncbi:ATP-binding cassette domain-containing protein (plasmid) [Bradyrhizobium sp. ISRA443]|uniref:ABC transporter ATP-binding protein n=1 Tax=unclassified Bradyrhizobium TaxID=2631580 RepID=UPI0024788FB5|nr:MULTISPECIES: ATP-binding cassette domain-containing protein [unclassified Bradyrhizobium]WGS03102.1 ATP-binding cassette domain-containing protein [Bradyrhizobium sp. ISRA436]WGS09865.1 ATP-binding cassette domain-containing protein [Bradyrhizobium sp. ISRA437]WGS16750.1 ATP-binding cassette domain-containing protein [Bradyrhizobium sp. ISRA443]
MGAVSIELNSVWLEYPIYGHRSLKNALLRFAMNGRRPDGDVTCVGALKDINLRFDDGDRVGLIGGNGAGKTTMLRVLAGAMSPTRGNVQRIGFTSTLFDVYLGMNGEATGWDNVMLRGLFLGLTPDEIRARTEDIVAFSGLTHDQLDRPMRTFSSGMMLRLAFSVATCVSPEILLMDEWIWVSDASFIERAQKRMTEMVDRAKILVIATHADYLIQQLCNKAVLLSEGEVRGVGPVDEILSIYHGKNGAG